jgi:hypothetical protein
VWLILDYPIVNCLRIETKPIGSLRRPRRRVDIQSAAEDGGLSILDDLRIEIKTAWLLSTLFLKVQLFIHQRRNAGQFLAL